MAISTTSNEKDHPPGATLDYGFNYTSILATGETITSSVWSVTAADGTSTADITLASQQIVAGITSIFAAGGVRGKIYFLINTITTSNNPNRVTSRFMVLSCKLVG